MLIDKLTTSLSCHTKSTPNVLTIMNYMRSKANPKLFTTTKPELP